MQLNFVVANDHGNDQTNYCVANSQQKFKPNNIVEVFLKQMTVLRYVSVVEIGDSQIK
jgi:hypothetical protein